MRKIWSLEEEAANLSRLFVGVNQAAFARDHGVPGGPSMLSQHIKGRRPMNLPAAMAYAKGFKLELKDISPRLAKMANELSTNLNAISARQQAMRNALAKGVDPGLDREALIYELREAMSLIEFYRDSQSSGGADPIAINRAVAVLGAAIQSVPRTEREEIGRHLAALITAPDSAELQAELSNSLATSKALSRTKSVKSA